LALPAYSHFRICRYNDGVSNISHTRITALKPLQKNAIKRTKRQRPQCNFSWFRCARRHHGNRQRARPHDLFQKYQSVYPGHFHIKRQNIGLYLINQITRLTGVVCLADDLDPGSAHKQRANEQAHRARVIKIKILIGRTRCVTSSSTTYPFKREKDQASRKAWSFS